MKMRALFVLALALQPALAAAQTDAEATVEINLQDAPLSKAAELYVSFSKCVVKIAPGRYPVTTLRVERPVSRFEALQLLEGIWRSSGIVVIKRLLPCRLYLFADAASVPDGLRDERDADPPPSGIERRVIRKPWEQTGDPPES